MRLSVMFEVGNLPVLPIRPVLPKEAPTRTPVTPQLKLPGARRRYDGLAISLALHVLVLVVLVGHGDRIWSRTLQPGDPALPAGGSAGGGGGNRVAYITLPSIPKPSTPPQFEVMAPVSPPKQVEIAVPEPVVPPVAELQPRDTAIATEAVREGSENVNGNAGPDIGVGAGQSNGGSPGAGAGTGGGGEGGTFRPPEPRNISLPFDEPPKELRGASLNVTFWVRIDGEVERYTVQPAIKDREYARKFDKVMRAFRFTPARAPDGTLVPDTTTISFTLQGKSSS
ncbi:MAG TPA: hypothetical protein VFS51_03115 [Gemmatimonadales bacterium]|nr:hypothetical protein [Gemmatimonadales bacterium]